MQQPNDHRTPTQKSFRFVTWVLGAVVLCGVIYTVAQQFVSVERREDPTIERLMAQWKSAGLPTGILLPADDPMGATRAAEADINGTPVLVYQFNPLDPVQLKRLDEIKEQGSIMHDGRKTPVIVNGPFVLANYDQHPDKDAIIETFKGFGTFEGIRAEQKLDMPPK